MSDQNTDIAPIAPITDVTQFIEKAITNPDTDPEKLHQILDFQERILDRQAEYDFNSAMVALRKELQPIVKNKANKQTSSKYADLNAIKKAVDPLLEKHGFYDSYDDDFPEDGVIITTCILTHAGGHSRKNKVRFKRDNVGIKGTANKTDVHGDASAMTYGQRLSLCRALGIRISEDDDGNAAGNEAIHPDNAEKLKQLIKETNSDTKAFCEMFGCNDVDSLPQRELRKANAILISKRAEMQAKGEINDTP